MDLRLYHRVMPAARGDANAVNAPPNARSSPMNCVLDAHCAYHGTILAWHSAGQVSGTMDTPPRVAGQKLLVTSPSSEVVHE